MSNALPREAIMSALAELPGWAYDADRLSKTYQLGDFRQAVAFIVRLSFEAEAMNHHPELCNVYNRVQLSLTTHDAGNRVTAKDLELAGRIDSVFPSESTAE